MMRWIDRLLDKITMYRLVLYYLIFLLAAAVGLSFAHILAYNPFALLFSTAFLLAACAVTNYVFARTFAVPANAESTYITALILALIITPIQGFGDLWFLFWAAVLSMASKYIVTLRGKHLFNPAAFAVALTALTVNQTASWWVGDTAMLFFVAAGGVLIVRKIRRFDLVFSFFLTAIGTTLALTFLQGGNLLTALQNMFLASPLVFFAF